MSYGIDRTGYNLPPGCSTNDLPGNTPEDEAFERFLESEEYAAIEDETDDLIERAFQKWYAEISEPPSFFDDDDAA